MAERHCYTCHLVLTLDNAVRDKRKPGGMGYLCKACNRARNKAWEQSAAGAATRRAQYLRRRDNDENRARLAKNQRAEYQRTGWRSRYERNIADPEKYAARRAALYAVKIGKLRRPEACSDCGKTCKPHAHHADYSKPLDVTWLCGRCHGKEHRRIA
jgi:ribosomal protein S27AE